VTAWPLRAAAFVLVAAITLQDHGIFGWGRSDPAEHLGLVVATLLAAGAFLAGWFVVDVQSRRRDVPAWVLPVMLIGLGASAGLVSSLHIAETMVAFCVMAALGAGSELSIGPAVAVASSGILAIEISSLSFGYNSGDLGWPLLIIAALLFGRNRRDAHLLTAQSLALVAQSEQTLVEHERAATLDERTRIAREIHDLLAHSLGALGIQLEAAQALLTDAKDIDRALPILSQARRLAASGLEETRHAIEALRIDAPPLPETLASLAEGHIRQQQTPVTLTVTGHVRALDADANLALIRTAQEALANAAKHSPSAPIAIHLDYEADRTNVSIATELDSTAPTPSAATATNGASGGYGLAGMRERLLLIGGTLTAGPSGPGWTVEAQIPV
jgi:signal transduction histidine kinase